MKLNIHLECFAIRKDPLVFPDSMLVKNAGINKITS